MFEEVHDDREFTTSVHYLKFPLTQKAKILLSDEAPESLHLTIELDHPNLTVQVVLPSECVRSLQKDL